MWYGRPITYCVEEIPELKSLYINIIKQIIQTKLKQGMCIMKINKYDYRLGYVTYIHVQ